MRFDVLDPDSRTTQYNEARLHNKSAQQIIPSARFVIVCFDIVSSADKLHMLMRELVTWQPKHGQRRPDLTYSKLFTTVGGRG